MTTTPSASSSPPRPHGPVGPEALDRTIQTTNPRGWWALAASGVVIVLVGAWSVLATVPQQVTSHAVVSSFQHSYDISAPIDGIVTFDQQLTGQVRGHQQVGTVTPYAGGAPVPVMSSQAGEVTSINVTVGQGVSAGTVLATIYTTPDPAQGIDIFAYLPISEATHYFTGQDVAVYVNDVATSTTTTTVGQVVNVATSPSTLDGIAIESGSDTLAQRWVDEGGGAPFRVIVRLDQWPADASPPSPGEPVTIINTFGSLHPIQLLFGGG